MTRKLCGGLVIAACQHEGIANRLVAPPADVSGKTQLVDPNQARGTTVDVCVSVAVMFSEHKVTNITIMSMRREQKHPVSIGRC